MKFQDGHKWGGRDVPPRVVVGTAYHLLRRDVHPFAKPLFPFEGYGGLSIVAGTPRPVLHHHLDTIDRKSVV